MRFTSFCDKSALVITVSLNPVPKRCFLWKMRFPSICNKTVLVITVSVNLVPKRRFWCKMRFTSFCDPETEIAGTPEYFVGQSPGIGYPSSCFIPNEVPQVPYHSLAGGTFGPGQTAFQ